MEGPSWIGIGAQRSGTTWLTELLLQHPEAHLSRLGRKELHFFDRFLGRELTDEDRRRYLGFFEQPGSGEFTPGYMRWLWVPPLIRETCGEDVTLLVVLRDPVERFASAIRWNLSLAEEEAGPSRPGWLKHRGSDALWAGMYATQLRLWASIFPRSRIVIEQYERAILDPRAAVGRIWSRLGLASAGVELHGIDAETATTTSGGPDLEGLTEHLRSVYEPEVEALVDDWGIDRSLWPNFR